MNLEDYCSTCKFYAKIEKHDHTKPTYTVSDEPGFACTARKKIMHIVGDIEVDPVPFMKCDLREE